MNSKILKKEVKILLIAIADLQLRIKALEKETKLLIKEFESLSYRCSGLSGKTGPG